MGLFWKDRHEGSEADRRPPITPGTPGHCPACDGLGFVDRADIELHVQYQRCRDCGQRWEYRFDADGTLLEIILDARGGPTGTRDAPRSTSAR